MNPFFAPTTEMCIRDRCRIAWGRTVTREALYANGDSVTFYTRYAD